MLNITKNISLTSHSQITENGKTVNVAGFTASIDSSNPTKYSMNYYMENAELFESHYDEVMADYSAFCKQVFAVKNEMLQKANS